MKLITPKGTGWPDYTDILHRIAVESYGKLQDFYYFTAIDLVVQPNIWHEVPLPSLKEDSVAYLNQFEISIPYNYLIEMRIKNERWGANEIVCFGYQTVSFFTRDGLLYKYGDNFYVRFIIHADITDLILATARVHGIWEKGVKLLE